MDKAKKKTIMDMTPQELIASLTASIGEATKAQINTALIPVHAELRELKLDVQGLKEDVKRIEHKLDTAVQDHEERLEIIEEHLELPHKN